METIAMQYCETLTVPTIVIITIIIIIALLFPFEERQQPYLEHFGVIYLVRSQNFGNVPNEWSFSNVGM